MRKRVLLTITMCLPYTAFAGGGVGRTLGDIGRQLDPTPRDSGFRRTVRQLDPTPRDSGVRRTLRDMDIGHSKSKIRKDLRSIDPSNPDSSNYVGPGKNRKKERVKYTDKVETAASWVSHHLDVNTLKGMWDVIGEQDENWKCGFFSGTKSLKAANHEWNDLEFAKNNYYYSLKVGKHKVGATPNQLERYLEKCDGASCSWEKWSDFDGAKNWIKSEIDSGYSPVLLLFNDYILDQHYVSAVGYDSNHVLIMNTNMVLELYRWSDLKYNMRVYGAMYKSTSLNTYNIVTVH